MKEFEVLRYLRSKGVVQTGIPYLTMGDWGTLRGILALPQAKTEKAVDEIVANGWEYYVEENLRRMDKEIQQKQHKYPLLK